MFPLSFAQVTSVVTNVCGSLNEQLPGLLFIGPLLLPFVNLVCALANAVLDVGPEGLNVLFGIQFAS